MFWFQLLSPVGNSNISLFAFYKFFYWVSDFYNLLISKLRVLLLGIKAQTEPRSRLARNVSNYVQEDNSPSIPPSRDRHILAMLCLFFLLFRRRCLPFCLKFHSCLMSSIREFLIPSGIGGFTQGWRFRKSVLRECAGLALLLDDRQDHLDLVRLVVVPNFFEALLKESMLIILMVNDLKWRES